MKKIIFIDDEVLYCKYYLEELREVYEVIYCESAQGGLDAVAHHPDTSLAILDVMMPIPEGVQLSDVLRSYKDTGLWILTKIKPTLIIRALPVIVLTNRVPDTFRSFLDIVLKEIKDASGRTVDQIAVRTKTLCPAQNIVHEAETMLSKFA